MGNGNGFPIVLDPVDDFKLLSDIAAARAIGAGDIIGVQRVETV